MKPELKEEFLNKLNGYCGSSPPVTSDTHWFPRTCCTIHKKYDNRTPGLFKLENSGKEAIGLCSKTYVVKNADKTKSSTKGINPRRLVDPFRTMNEVLRTQQSASSSNVGFRAKDNTVYTYEQERAAIPYFYVKRVVHSDGVHTSPLDMTLTPALKKLDKEAPDDGEEFCLEEDITPSTFEEIFAQMREDEELDQTGHFDDQMRVESNVEEDGHQMECDVPENSSQNEDEHQMECQELHDPIQFEDFPSLSYQEEERLATIIRHEDLRVAVRHRRKIGRYSL